jgi:hypothetical protein
MCRSWPQAVREQIVAEGEPTWFVRVAAFVADGKGL